MSILRVRTPDGGNHDVLLEPANPGWTTGGGGLNGVNVGQMRPILTAGVTLSNREGRTMKNASDAHWKRRYSVRPENRMEERP